MKLGNGRESHKQQAFIIYNHYSLHRVHVELFTHSPKVYAMELCTVILAIFVAVMLCIPCIIRWCLSKTRQVPEDAGQLQSVALQRSQAPELYDFIQKVINLFNGQRLKGDQFAVLIFTAESESSRMGSIRFRDPWCATCLVNITHHISLVII